MAEDPGEDVGDIGDEPLISLISSCSGDVEILHLTGAASGNKRGSCSIYNRHVLTSCIGGGIDAPIGHN